MKHKLVKWKEVEDFIKNLSERLPKKISGVYGIPRGGLCMAVMLSHYANIPVLQAPCKNCIVIDDIADTGLTLLHCKEKGYFIATMYYHKQSKVVPNYYEKEKKDQWIVFPWEIQKEV